VGEAQRLPGEVAKQLLMSGGGGGGDVAAALRKAVAFCERKFCEANLPSADDDDHAEEEGSPRAEVRLRGGLWLGQLHTHTRALMPSTLLARTLNHGLML
jgi:hypothetical protein